MDAQDASSLLASLRERAAELEAAVRLVRRHLTTRSCFERRSRRLERARKRKGLFGLVSMVVIVVEECIRAKNNSKQRKKKLNNSNSSLFTYK